MWRFVQVTDPHLGSTTDGVWNNGFICTMMPDVMRCLRRDLAGIKPEFILATGDISSQQTRDAMFASRDLMDSLGFPYYPMGGNHDFVLEDSRKWFIEAFHAQLPTASTVYSFDHENLHFAVIDPWWKWSDDTLSEISERAIAEKMQTDLKGARWAVPPHQLEWLDEDLRANPNKPTIVATHYPAMPIPDRMRRPGIQDSGALDNADDLIRVMKAHPQVKAVFSGHMHMHYITVDEGITHVVTGALPEYPTEYRDIEVYEDRIELYTRGLSDTSFASRSLIPGNEWTLGEPGDRRTTISLL
jgi:3',5'-cyclic AMP phosphodiesterase CpdA